MILLTFSICSMVSYPFQWCFTMSSDATEIHGAALESTRWFFTWKLKTVLLGKRPSKKIYATPLEVEDST